MKRETRDNIIENIGLAWVYSNPKARAYLNEALKGFAQHEKDEQEGAERLFAYITEDNPEQTQSFGNVKPAEKLGKVSRKLLAILSERAYPVTMDTLMRETGAPSRWAVHKQIQCLRENGYDVRVVTTGRKKRKYQLVG